VALSITAFPVLARILIERRLERARSGTLALAAAALNDALAWCALAVVLAVLGARSGWSAAVALGGTAAFAGALAGLSTLLSPVLVLWLLAAVLVAQVVVELASHDEHALETGPI
jgi:Kef-type K+ transport system membrane component KefB